MDTKVLRSAYDRLLDAAAIRDLGNADDGGWNADQILAHLLSVDASIAAVALGIVSRLAAHLRQPHLPRHLES